SSTLFTRAPHTELYTLSLHDALPIYRRVPQDAGPRERHGARRDAAHLGGPRGLLALRLRIRDGGSAGSARRGLRARATPRRSRSRAPDIGPLGLALVGAIHAELLELAGEGSAPPAETS